MDPEGYCHDLGPQAFAYVDEDEHARVNDEALQYAYEHNLIEDYTLNSFSMSHLLAPLVQSTLPSITEDGFTDASHLPYLEIPVPRVGDTLAISQSAQKLRDEALQELTDGEVKSLTRGIMNSGNTKHLRLELPLLRTDDERDMREFRKELATQREVRIGDHRLPLDLVTGEGMQFPDTARSEANELLRKLENERLGITRSALKFLADIVKDDYDEEEQWKSLLEEVKGTKWVRNPGLEKLELPINPQSNEDQSVTPDDAYLIPIPSDPSSSIFADDLRAAEEQLFEEFGDVWSEPTSPILDRFLDVEISEEDKKGFLNTDFSLEQSTEYNLDHHKIEPPILPFSPLQEQSLSETEAFGSFVAQQMDIDGLAAEFLQNLSDDDFEEELASVADLTMKTVEQEQLHAADATARVPVPIMDFSIPEPEWKRLGNNSQAIFKYIKCGNESLFRLPQWPRNSVIESKLIWRPIGSEASKVSTKETIDADDDLVESFIISLNSDGVPSSLDFVQKRTKLAILEHMTEDDEIEVHLEKPKQRITNSFGAIKRVLDASDSTISKKPRLPSTYIGDNGQLLVGGSPGASTKLLSNFMELHAPKKKWSVSKYFPAAEHATSALQVPGNQPKKAQESGENGKSTGGDSDSCSKSPARAQYPSIKTPSAPLTIIISLTAPRHLIKGLEGLLPGLTLMERDYNKHNTSVWSPGSVSRTEVVPPLAFDADLTLSPSTGIITTSMIKVRQKPRPHASKNSVQERVEKIAPRYGRLIILVGGEGGPDDTFGEMSSSDAAALTSFQGFASGLWCKALVYYIGGGDDTLSRWVASLVCRYGQSDPSLQACLMEDETLWELWLRRAGFNAYAAQMVAGQLKVPKADTATAGEQHGLAAFVTMTRNDRMRLFGPVVGTRVMERVSRVVDEIWNKP
ncbi:hypothetical protein KVR01_003292 [Diaporthe batatas]|uniref:uncharacterized protein n=1 Tax=Diaporthe batatas TaxID=748121 RepID=UPI001D053545|nr:uncharacterized protein KVR01_003292 [Diaporthe batatas]KAG8167603.1 hypothetical protein KVR01_003292 [Diaporthe batatas]